MGGLCLDGTAVEYYPLCTYMRNILLPILQIIISILLITAILMQQRGTGLGAAFGGAGDVFRTKRGIEKGLFYATICLSVLFLGGSRLGPACLEFLDASGGVDKLFLASVEWVAIAADFNINYRLG